MLNAAAATVDPALKVIDYADPNVAHDMANGAMNTDASTLVANIRSSIRRGHTQWRGGPMRPDRVCLVGSGPSLNSTLEELRQLVWEGAALVTMNGAYHWCIEHGLRPTTQIVMDARPTNARFLQPAVPKCNYVLASQCAPEVWDAVEERPHVWIFHAVVKGEGDASNLLDEYYSGQWVGIGGGTTVATRSIGLLRTAGYLRFDLFGVDSCWLGSEHHAIQQPENTRDQRLRLRVSLRDTPDQYREFIVAGWHLKQLEDALTVLKINGQHLMVTVHGDGLLAHVMRELSTADVNNLVMNTSEEK